MAPLGGGGARAKETLVAGGRDLVGLSRICPQVDVLDDGNGRRRGLLPAYPLGGGRGQACGGAGPLGGLRNTQKFRRSCQIRRFSRSSCRAWRPIGAEEIFRDRILGRAFAHRMVVGSGTNSPRTLCGPWGKITYAQPTWCGVWCGNAKIPRGNPTKTCRVCQSLQSARSHMWRPVSRMLRALSTRSGLPDGWREFSKTSDPPQPELGTRRTHLINPGYHPCRLLSA